MPRPPVFTVAQNSPITASGQSAGIVVQPVGNVGGDVSCHVAVTGVSGSTPSMTVSFQWSWNNSTWINGSAAETFTPFTAAGAALLTVPSRAPFARAAWTVSGGTPSFTAAIAIWS